MTVLLVPLSLAQSLLHHRWPIKCSCIKIGTKKMFPLEVYSTTAPPRGALDKASPTHPISSSQISKSQHTHNQVPAAWPLYKCHFQTILELHPPNVMLPLNCSHTELLGLPLSEWPSGQWHWMRQTFPQPRIWPVLTTQWPAIATTWAVTTQELGPLVISKDTITGKWAFPSKQNKLIQAEVGERTFRSHVNSTRARKMQR